MNTKQHIASENFSPPVLHVTLLHTSSLWRYYPNIYVLITKYRRPRLLYCALLSPTNLTDHVFLTRDDRLLALPPALGAGLEELASWSHEGRGSRYLPNMSMNPESCMRTLHIFYSTSTTTPQTCPSPVRQWNISTQFLHLSYCLIRMNTQLVAMLDNYPPRCIPRPSPQGVGKRQEGNWAT